jgi:hypothetical protein
MPWVCGVQVLYGVCGVHVVDGGGVQVLNGVGGIHVLVECKVSMFEMGHVVSLICKLHSVMTPSAPDTYKVT